MQQNGIKLSPCVSCGKSVESKTCPRKYCADCSAARAKERARLSAEKKRRKNGIKPVKGVEHFCKDCSKGFIRFAIRSTRCTDCQAKFAAEKARRASRKKSEARGAVKIGTRLSCTNCKASFEKTGSRDRYCTACKVLQKAGKLLHDRKRKREYAKRWNERQRTQNPEKMCRLNRERRLRRMQNPAYVLRERISAGIRQSLILGKQGWRWEKLVGYTVHELKHYLERQFLKGMSWDNMGQWHIDHIVPVSSFNYDSYDDPVFKRCWALTNLRPLWAADNHRKGDRIHYLL